MTTEEDRERMAEHLRRVRDGGGDTRSLQGLFSAVDVPAALGYFEARTDDIVPPEEREA